MKFTLYCSYNGVHNTFENDTVILHNVLITDKSLVDTEGNDREYIFRLIVAKNGKLCLLLVGHN